MPRRRIVETLYSSRSKYEIVRIDYDAIPLFESTDYYVFRDGARVAGVFKDLRHAIAWAQRQGARS